MEFRAQNSPSDPLTGQPLDEPVDESLDAAHAEATLSDRYSSRLLMFATRRTGDASAAEDIAQETLRTVVDALRSGRVENLAALPGFVFTTARNICMHWERSAGRENSALSRYQTDSDLSRTQPPDALTRLIAEDRRRIVRRALDALSSDDRGLLSMLYYEGIGSDVVATRLNITPAAVRVRKHRALGRLAALLGESKGNKTDGAGTLD
jgi:RNA polymerase sigma-70 factor (ECF subfamily)